LATDTSPEGSARRTERSAGFHSFPYRTGAVTGAGAVPVGYPATVLLTATRALDVVGGGPAPVDALPGWKAVGWLFYNAHGVGVRFVGAGGTVGVGFVETSGGTLPLPVLPAVGYPLLFGAMGGVAAAVLSLTPAADR